MEHPRHRCENGAALVSLCVPGAGCVENLQQPAPALAALSNNKLAKEIFPGVLPAVPSWRSPLELVVQDTLVAKNSHAIQTHSSRVKQLGVLLWPHRVYIPF